MKQYTITVEDQPHPGRTVWLCPGEGKGDGSASRPFRVKTPDDFDNLIKSYHGEECKGPVAFRLMPGTYYTRGAWNHPDFATLWNKDALIGEAGSILGLADPVTETNGVERPDIHVLSVGSDYHTSDECRVENLSIIGNLIAGKYVTSGVRCYGVGTILRGLWIDKIYGSIDPVQAPWAKIPLEAFGVSFSRASHGVVGDCRVLGYQKPKSYLSAFSGASLGVVFRDCCAYGSNQHAAFTLYSGCVVDSCESNGFGYGIYNDSENVSNARVIGGSFDCGRVGVGLVADKAQSKASITIRDAYFNTPSLLLELISRGGAFADILVDSCRLWASANEKRTLFSTDGTPDNTRLVRFRNCVVPDLLRVNNPNKVPYSMEGMMSWSGKRFLDTKPVGLTAMVEEV